MEKVSLFNVKCYNCGKDHGDLYFNRDDGKWYCRKDFYKPKDKPMISKKCGGKRK